MNEWWHWQRRRKRDRLEADRASVESGTVALIRSAIGEGTAVPLRQPLVRPARDRKAPTQSFRLADVSRRQMERYRRGL